MRKHLRLKRKKIYVTINVINLHNKLHKSLEERAFYEFK